MNSTNWHKVAVHAAAISIIFDCILLAAHYGFVYYLKALAVAYILSRTTIQSNKP